MSKFDEIVMDVKLIASDFVHLGAHIVELFADVIVFWKEIKKWKEKIEFELDIMRAMWLDR